MEAFSIGTIDIVIVAVYLLFIIWWGIKNGKSTDAQSYFWLDARCLGGWLDFRYLQPVYPVQH